MGTVFPDFNLDDLLTNADSHVAGELATSPEVVDVGHDLDLSKVPIQARKWHKVRDVVAVVVDLKGSTQLGLNKWAASTASIYEAAIRPVVDIMVSHGADDIDIQGDGVVGLFWGDKRTERAVAAGISVQTFSGTKLVPRLIKKWPTLPATGFKVGIAASPPLVKRIGIPRTEHQEEVWPGKAVNYATKAAQCADAHQLIVTKTVWDRISNNDYLTHSCGCPYGTVQAIDWQAKTIDRLATDETDRDGRLLVNMWCTEHGAEFCAAVLAGKTTRADVVRDATHSILLAGAGVAMGTVAAGLLAGNVSVMTMPVVVLILAVAAAVTALAGLAYT